MKKKRKSALLAALLSFCTLGLSACDQADSSNSSNEELWTIEKVYAEAKNLGFEGTLEELIALFKGDTGEKGETGLPGEKGDPGVGITDVVINDKGELLIYLSNANTINCGVIVTTPEIDEYVYSNDKQLLEFVVEAQDYLKTATILYGNLIETTNYKEGINFTYETGLEFCTENSSYIARLYERHPIFSSRYQHSLFYEPYGCFVENVYYSIRTSINSFENVYVDIGVYVANVKTGLDTVQDSLDLLTTIVSVNGADDLEYYQSETSNKKPQEATLDNFIEKSKITTSLIEVIYSGLNGALDVVNSIHNNLNFISLANGYLRDLYEIKDDLLAEYNSGVASAKIVEIYTNLEFSYKCAMDYNTRKLEEVQAALNQIRMNLEVLTYINEL